MPATRRKSEHLGGKEFLHIDSKTVGRGFESSCPCHDAWSKSIRPRKKEKSGDFERFLRFFRACLFSNLYRSIFDFSSSRRDRTTENTLFGEFNNEFFAFDTKCLQIVRYKNTPSLPWEDPNPRNSWKQLFQNHSIVFAKGSEGACKTVLLWRKARK